MGEKPQPQNKSNIGQIILGLVLFVVPFVFFYRHFMEGEKIAAEQAKNEPNQ